jgi:ribosome-binding factor A
MPTHRGLRIAEAIREVVATTILFDVADPRVRSVTVLRVEVAPDLKNATVYVSIMGTEAQRAAAFSGLKHATGFIQARVASRLQTRFTPVLRFEHDDSIKKSAEMARLIEDALASDQKPAVVSTEPAAVTPDVTAACKSARGHPEVGTMPECSSAADNA